MPEITNFALKVSPLSFEQKEQKHDQLKVVQNRPFYAKTVLIGCIGSALAALAIWVASRLTTDATDANLLTDKVQPIDQWVNLKTDKLVDTGHILNSVANGGSVDRLNVSVNAAVDFAATTFISLVTKDASSTAPSLILTDNFLNVSCDLLDRGVDDAVVKLAQNLILNTPSTLLVDPKAERFLSSQLYQTDNNKLTQADDPFVQACSNLTCSTDLSRCINPTSNIDSGLSPSITEIFNQQSPLDDKKSDFVISMLNDFSDLKITGFKNTDGEDLLMIAAKHGHVKIARYLLETRKFPILKDGIGQTALMKAAQNGQAEVVDIFLQNGVIFDLLDRKGRTALHYAAENGHEKVLALLTKNKTELVHFIDLKDKINGMTALHYAAQNGHEKVVQMLLDNKAQVNLQDRDSVIAGWTALNFAYCNNQDKVIKILLENGAKTELQLIFPNWLLDIFGVK